MVEIIKTPSAIRGTSESGLRESTETISQRTAVTLAEVYIKNIESFSAGTGRSGNRTNSFSVDDTRDFLKAIQPYGAVKDANGVTLNDKMATATAVKYMELLAEADATGNLNSAEKAANLAGAYIDAKNQTNIDQAKEAEARREKLGKAIGIVSELGIYYGAKNIINPEIIADALGKGAAAVVEGNAKGNNVDDAVKQNRATLENQQATNKISLVQVYEQGAFNRTSGTKTATADEKTKAQEFLADLKQYNESLPPTAKILDGNGRLIKPSQMNDRQKDSMEDIFTTSDPAGGRLSARMRATYNELLNATERQVKGL